MFSTTLVIVLINMGSVLMDSNIQELCSKSYFDSFEVQYSTALRYDLQLNRRIDSKYHSWHLLIEQQYGGFKSIKISYTLKDGKAPDSPLLQPMACAMNMNISYSGLFLSLANSNVEGKFYWNLTDIMIINDKIKGPEVNYTQTAEHLYEKFERAYWRVKKRLEREVMTKPLNRPNLWLNGLLCVVSFKHFYVIEDNTDSMNALNRTQYVSELKIKELKPQIDSSVWKEKAKVAPVLEFSLESMNKTVFDFFGINCSDIPTYAKSKHFLSTDTLWIIFWGLIVSGIIFSLIDLFVAIKRNNNQMPGNDRRNGQRVAQ